MIYPTLMCQNYCVCRLRSMDINRIIQTLLTLHTNTLILCGVFFFIHPQIWVILVRKLQGLYLFIRILVISMLKPNHGRIYYWAYSESYGAVNMCTTCIIHSCIMPDQFTYLKGHGLNKVNENRVIDDWLETINDNQTTGACFFRYF